MLVGAALTRVLASPERACLLESLSSNSSYSSNLESRDGVAPTIQSGGHIAEFSISKFFEQSDEPVRDRGGAAGVMSLHELLDITNGALESFSAIAEFLALLFHTPQQTRGDL